MSGLPLMQAYAIPLNAPSCSLCNTYTCSVLKHRVRRIKRQNSSAAKRRLHQARKAQREFCDRQRLHTIKSILSEEYPRSIPF